MVHDIQHYNIILNSVITRYSSGKKNDALKHFEMEINHKRQYYDIITTSRNKSSENIPVFSGCFIFRTQMFL